MSDESHADDTRVLYNAECPVCSYEIDHYRAYTTAQDIPVRYEDLNADDLKDWGLDAETAAKRLHVLYRGTLLSGIPAFIVLWRQMPRYRWLARIVSLPGVRHLAIAIYDAILAPALFAWHKRRQKRAVAKG